MLTGKVIWKRTLRGSRLKWEDNSRINLTEIGVDTRN